MKTRPDAAIAALGYFPRAMLRPGREALLAYIQDLEGDKRRLDWLEAHPLKANVHGGSDDGHEGTAWAIAAHSLSLREALDAAAAAHREAK